VQGLAIVPSFCSAAICFSPGLLSLHANRCIERPVERRRRVPAETPDVEYSFVRRKKDRAAESRREM
jgi:hypothetical protein